VNSSQFTAALQSLKTIVDGIASRLNKDTTPPTAPSIKATGLSNALSVALIIQSVDAGGL